MVWSPKVVSVLSSQCFRPASVPQCSPGAAETMTRPIYGTCACGCGFEIRVAKYPSWQAKFRRGHSLKCKRGIPDGVRVDEEDIPMLSRFHWHIGSQGYVWTFIGSGPVSMHRMILGFPKLETDHINGIRTDNRKSNLRSVSTAINQQNRRGASATNLSTGVRGVSYMHQRTSKKKFHASATAFGIKHEAYFESLQEADEWVRATRARVMPGVVSCPNP